MHAQLIAHSEAAVALPSDKTALGRRKYVKVVRQGRDMDQASQQNFRQLDQETVVADIEYDGVEYLGIADLQL
jgi:hypothetical protein